MKGEIELKNTSECELQDDNSFAATAKEALERVCSGKALDSLPRYYSKEFVDHVNEMNFQGLEGARRSVELYTKVLSDLDVVVKEQLTDGDRVTSRFMVSGKSFGKKIRINGITISRFQEGLIVEDWSVTDTLGILRQLGVWRSALVGLRYWKAL
jgi:predicted ester cyclase